MFRHALPKLSGISHSRHVRLRGIKVVLCAIAMLFMVWIASLPARAQSGGWSEPYRLSSDAGKASEASLATDRFGFVHSFWTETLFADGRHLIQYARFDGATWSPSNAIHVAGREIENVSAAIDQQGILYIAWTEGLAGPAYFTSAPASDALSARSWVKPLLIDIPAGIIRMKVDSRGVFHILYINRGDDPGVYYVRSTDYGQSWSESLWLDPDILPDHALNSLNFDLDENDGLHAVWFYSGRESSGDPDLVRYARSMDGGNTWSSPVAIDQTNEAGDHALTHASPRMIIQGITVYVVWAAGDLPYRHYRLSRDAGQTWSPPGAIFGDLHGQAFDGLTVDGTGRVHFVGQIRYPIGIYHAYWDQTQWTSPELVYIIAEEESEIDGRVHAHDINVIVRAGNQLILTFGDGPADPNRRLFAMHRVLDDLPPLQTMPTPALPASLVPLPGPSQIPPTPLPTATMPGFGTDTQLSGYIPSPDIGLQVGLIPTLLLLGSTVVIRLWHNRTH